MDTLQGYIDWINSRLGPNVYCVTTLKQRVETGPNGRVWVPGDPDTYARTYDQFIKRLSHRVYGKAYRRRKRLIPNAATLEGNGSGHKYLNRHHRASVDFMAAIQSSGPKVRYHLNIMLRKPEWLDLDELRSSFVEEWNGCEWAMPNIYLQRSTGDCVAYSLKDGPETLLTRSLRF